MPADALAAYGVADGRWVPLKDILFAVGAMPRAAAAGLPWGVDQQLLEEVDGLAAAQVAHLMGVGRDPAYRHEVSRLAMGANLGRLLSRLHAAAADDGERPRAAQAVHLTSCHDTTPLPMLVALDEWDGLWPCFCAALSFELWAPEPGEGGPPLVRLLANTRTVGAPLREAARWTLPQFEALVAPLVPPGDDEAECRPRSAEFPPELALGAQF